MNLYMHPIQQTIRQAALPATFLWIGFVSAISFMEAWLKFRAPGITLPLGLGIGSLVFKALNMMEWLFALLIATRFILNRRSETRRSVTQYMIILLLLLVQTLWLLPALDARIPLYQQGLEVPSSPLHIYYVVAEVIKVTLLFIVGIGFLKEAR